MSTISSGFFKSAIDDEQNYVLTMYFPYALVYDHVGRVDELALDPIAYVIREDGISVGVELTDEEVMSGRYLSVMERVLGDDKLLELIDSVGEDWVKPKEESVAQDE